MEVGSSGRFAPPTNWLKKSITVKPGIRFSQAVTLMGMERLMPLLLASKDLPFNGVCDSTCSVTLLELKILPLAERAKEYSSADLPARVPMLVSLEEMVDDPELDFVM